METSINGGAQGGSKGTSPPPPSVATSNSTASASPSASQELSAEDKLKALQDKTNAWKAAVTNQLNDAAKKNKILREELRVAREEKETALSELRLQLSREFKERTAMQIDELQVLNKQAEQLREEKKKLAEAHEAELKAFEVRLREACTFESEKAHSEEVEKWVRERDRLENALHAKEKEVDQAQHEASLLTARLERLGKQYEELSALIHVDAAGGAAATATGSPSLSVVSGVAQGSEEGDGPAGAASSVALAVNDAAHKQQLEAVRAELASKEQHVQRMLESAQREQEQERQQFLREVHRRDEQLAVLQALLKQAQSELSTSQQRISRAQTEKQSLEQHYAKKVSSLSNELALQLDQLGEAQRTTEDLTRQLREAKEQIRSLEGDAATREEAFQSLMLSEDDKQLVKQLQQSLLASRDEAEDWRLRYYQLQENRHGQAASRSEHAIDSQAAASVDPSKDSAAEGTTSILIDARHGSADPDTRLRAIAEREAALTAQAAQLETKAQLLRSAEVKLEEMKKSLASQASVLLRNTSAGAGGGPGGPNGGGGGFSGSGNHGGDRHRPLLQFESMDGGLRGWTSRQVSAVLSMRLQALLPVVLFIIILMMLWSAPTVKTTVQSTPAYVSRETNPATAKAEW